jgi:hypothetical protein
MRQTLFLLVLTVFSVCLPARGQPWSGGGIEGDPYLIEDANDMQAIGAAPNYWGAHFKMVNDVNLAQFTGTQFNIIGNDVNAFTGVFDGNNYTISNLTIHTVVGSGLALFGYINDSNAEIKNLGIENFDILGGGSSNNYIGGLCGFNEGGTIINCYATGSVRGYSLLGGLCGWNIHGTIINCHANVTVTSWGNDCKLGGLCGENYNGTISNCYATGQVTGRDNTWYIGGLCGLSSGTISNCYATGQVTGGNSSRGIGGLCGNNFFSGSITNCYANGLVTGGSGSQFLGGLCGEDHGSATNCFWDIETSNQLTSAIGIGKTTTELKQQSTFTNWDFVETWGIEDNQTYPFLKLTYPVGDLDLDKDVDLLDFAEFAEHWLESVE